MGAFARWIIYFTAVILAGWAPQAFALEKGCPNISLAATTSAPFTPIGINNLARSGEDLLFAIIVDQGNSSASLAQVSVDEAGLSLYVPPLPGAPFAGGPAQVVITDGTIECPPMNLDIEAMPRRDGATLDFVENAVRTVEGMATLSGADIRDMRDPNFEPETDLQAYVAVMARWLAWDRKDSIKARLMAQMENGPTQDHSLMDAFLAGAGYLDVSRDAAKFTAEYAANYKRKLAIVQTPSHQLSEDPVLSPVIMPTQEYPGVPALPWDKLPMGTVLTAQAATKSAPLASVDGAAIGKALAPDTPAELSRMMKLQFHSEVSGLPQVSVYRDMAGVVLGAGGKGLYELSGRKGPAAYLGKGYEAASEGLFVWAQVEKMMEGLYPSKFTGISVEYGPKSLDLQGNSDGKITAINVTTVSKGYDMSKLAMDMILQKLPAGEKGASLASKAWKNINNYKVFSAAKGRSYMDPAKAQQILQAMMVKDAAAATATGGAEGVGKMGGAFGISSLPDGIKISPINYPAVNVLETGYYEAINLNQGLLDLGFLGGGSLPYTALKEGTARVQTMPAPGKWGNNEIKKTIDIEIDNAKLRITPSRRVVGVDEPAEFEVIVKTEGNPDIDIQLIPDTYFVSRGAPKETKDSEGETIITYQLTVTPPPNASADVTARVKVHLKEAPEIKAEARIQHPSVSPESCVGWGETRQFELAPTDASVKAAKWKVSGPGSINNAGLYTAPNKGSKPVKIMVTALNARGKKMDDAEIELGCSCSWTFQASGGIATGDQAHIMSMPENSYQITFSDLSGEEGSGGVLIGIGDPFSGYGKDFESVCADGTVDGMMSMTVRDTAYAITEDAICPREDKNSCQRIAAPTISYKPTGSGFVRGLLTGQAYNLNTMDECAPVETFSLTFRAAPSAMSLGGLQGMAENMEGSIEDNPMAMMEMMSAIMGMSQQQDLCNPDE